MNNKPFLTYFILVLFFILPCTICFAQTNLETIDDVKSKYPDLDQYNETTLNNLGYQLIKQDKIEEAIEVFKFNCKTYPESWNTYDSLGEAFMINGETDFAILNYEKSLELNPSSVNGKRILEKLKNPVLAVFTGNYEFYYEGKYIVLIVYIENGKLMGIEPPDDPIEIKALNLEKLEFKAVKTVLSWEQDPSRPMEDKLERLGQKIIDRYNVVIEDWGDRPLDIRKQEMLEIYNAAWNENYGFVPFTQEEFDQIIDDMMLIMDKKLFIFLYIKGEAAAFFGGVPNVTEKLSRIGKFRHLELIRAIKLILGAKHTKGFRLGYLGVKPKFRRLGLDGVMLWKQKQYSSTKYKYCDMGWVLEDNKIVIKLIEMIKGKDSKTYTIYDKNIG